MEQPTLIGEWVRRSHGVLLRSFTRGTKVHLVESEVTDRLVMRCGRQMRLSGVNGTLRLFGRFSRDGGVWCRQCGQP